MRIFGRGAEAHRPDGSHRSDSVAAMMASPAGRPPSDAPCVFPRCSLPGTVRIRLSTADSSLADREVVLCRVHEAKAMAVRGMAEFLYRLVDAQHDASRRVLEASRPKRMERLDRPRYLELAARKLQEATEFLGAYSGPSCFHPDWFYVLQAAAEARGGPTSPGSSRMDRALQRLLTEPAHRRVDVVLRSSPTYAAKAATVTRNPRLLDVLKAETVERIEEFYLRTPRRQRITCIDIGFMRLPYIFEDCVITAQRESDVGPVSGAIVSYDPEVVAFERRSFTLLFDTIIRPTEHERAELIAFTENSLDAIKE